MTEIRVETDKYIVILPSSERSVPMRFERYGGPWPASYDMAYNNLIACLARDLHDARERLREEQEAKRRPVS